MPMRSSGLSAVQDMATPTIASTQYTCTLFGPSEGSSCKMRDTNSGSMASIVFSLNAECIHLLMLRPPVKHSSVGLFPENSSSNTIPKLYTSPAALTFSPHPYSALQNQPY
ncbi:hypothetical protein V8G54_005176 [Vigna mungo]|uniref:Uncharacterized protein n=1 Tax=Vigna mungo TaxID=3915 RepID=A0AAQ3PJL4_VIGMU